jgi:hypothetical protein
MCEPDRWNRDGTVERSLLRESLDTCEELRPQEETAWRIQAHPAGFLNRDIFELDGGEWFGHGIARFLVGVSGRKGTGHRLDGFSSSVSPRTTC